MADGRFEAGWLALREPVDHRSRARGLIIDLRRQGRRRGWSRLVDLGSGTGSNLRFVATRTPWARHWTVVDRDADLLGALQPPSPDVRVTRVVGDIGDRGLEAIDDGCHVATASALLDLVSERWLTGLRDRCASAGCAAYLALSYDGTVRWKGGSASVEDDALVLEAVNDHQRSDKGVGGALGPAAGRVASTLFGEAGFHVRVEPSPWVLAGPRDAELADALIEGWVEAAVELRPGDEDRIRRWARQRRDDLRDGSASVRVGHVDLLALPPDPAGAAGDRGGPGVGVAS